MTKGETMRRLLAVFDDDPPWNEAVPEMPPRLDGPAMHTRGAAESLRERAAKIEHAAACASRAPVWIRGERFESPCSCGANVQAIRLQGAAILTRGVDAS